MPCDYNQMIFFPFCSTICSLLRCGRTAEVCDALNDEWTHQFLYLGTLWKSSALPPALPYSAVGCRRANLQVQLWSEIRAKWLNYQRDAYRFPSPCLWRPIDEFRLAANKINLSVSPTKRRNRRNVWRLVLSWHRLVPNIQALLLALEYLYHYRILFTLARRWHSLREKKFRPIGSWGREAETPDALVWYIKNERCRCSPVWFFIQPVRQINRL